jgi:TolA-binding protein
VDDLSLDGAAFRWREALDAATDSLESVSRSRTALHFTSAELQARVAQLEHERDTTERALERLAGATHTHLQQHLRIRETRNAGRDRPQRLPGRLPMAPGAIERTLRP